MKQAAARQAEKDLQRQQAPAPPDAAVNFSPAVGKLAVFMAKEAFVAVKFKAKTSCLMLQSTSRLLLVSLHAMFMPKEAFVLSTSRLLLVSLHTVCMPKKAFSQSSWRLLVSLHIVFMPEEAFMPSS